MHPEVRINLAPLTPVPQERTGEPITPRLIVGAAIVVDGRVLACERADPPETAGGWEFPGGKAEPGESDVDALVRECEEELGVHIEVGEQVGPDVPMNGGRLLLRVYVAQLVGEQRPVALEHSALRWLGPGELDEVPWLPADKPIVTALEPLLSPSGQR